MMNSLGFYAQLWRGRTPLRALMNLGLARTGTWDGSILDVGGTPKSMPSYHDYLVRTPSSMVTSVNIDADAGPDIVGDAQHLPINDVTYDHAWCLNVLEHVADPGAAIKEMFRVLRPHGRAVIFTPFFIRIHGHPHDYYRYTATALTRFAEQAGFHVDRVDVVGGGPFLGAIAQLQIFLPRVLFVPSVVCARLCDRIVARLRPKLGDNWPLGYILLITKS